MNTTLKRLLAAVAAITAFVGFAVAPASAAPAPRPPAPKLIPHANTNCEQSSYLGTRVCYDETTGFGPVITIYSSGTTAYAAFGVSAADCQPFTATDAEWQYVSSSSTWIPGGPAAARCGGSTPSTADGTYGCTPPISFNICVPSGANHDLLEWFSNVAGFEFVWTN